MANQKMLPGTPAMPPSHVVTRSDMYFRPSTSFYKQSLVNERIKAAGINLEDVIKSFEALVATSVVTMSVQKLFESSLGFAFITMFDPNLMRNSKPDRIDFMKRNYVIAEQKTIGTLPPCSTIEKISKYSQAYSISAAFNVQSGVIENILNTFANPKTKLEKFMLERFKTVFLSEVEGVIQSLVGGHYSIAFEYFKSVLPDHNQLITINSILSSKNYMEDRIMSTDVNKALLELEALRKENTFCVNRSGLRGLQEIANNVLNNITQEPLYKERNSHTDGSEAKRKLKNYIREYIKMLDEELSLRESIPASSELFKEQTLLYKETYQILQEYLSPDSKIYDVTDLRLIQHVGEKTLEVLLKDPEVIPMRFLIDTRRGSIELTDEQVNMINATGYMIYHQETDPKGPSSGNLMKSLRGSSDYTPEEVVSTGANHGFIIRDFIGYLRPDGPVIIDSVSKMMKNFRNGPDKNWNKSVLEKFFVTVVGLSSPAEQILAQHARIINTKRYENECQKVIFPNSITFANASNKKVTVNQQTLCDDFLTNPVIYNYVAMESLYNEGLNYSPDYSRLTDVKKHFMCQGIYELFRKNERETVLLQDRFANVNPLKAKTTLARGKLLSRSMPMWETNKMMLPIRRQKIGLNSENGMTRKDSRDIGSLFKLDANPFVDIVMSDKRNINQPFTDCVKVSSILSPIDKLQFYMSPKLLVGNSGNYLSMSPNLREQMGIAFLNGNNGRLLTKESKETLRMWEKSLDLDKVPVPFVFLIHMYIITHTYRTMDKLLENRKSHRQMIDIAVYFFKKYEVVLGCTNLAFLRLLATDTRTSSYQLSKAAKGMLGYVEILTEMHLGLLDGIISVFGNGAAKNEEDRYKMYLKYGSEICWALDFSKPCIVPMSFAGDNICGKVFCLSEKNEVHAMMPVKETDATEQAKYLSTGDAGDIINYRKWTRVQRFNEIFDHNSIHQVVMNKLTFQLIEHLSGGRLALGHLDGDQCETIGKLLEANNELLLPGQDKDNKIDLKTENEGFKKLGRDNPAKNVMLDSNLEKDDEFYYRVFVADSKPSICLLSTCYGLMAVNSPPPTSLSFDRNFRHFSAFSTVGLPLIPCTYSIGSGDFSDYKSIMGTMDISYRLNDPSIVRCQTETEMPSDISSPTDLMLSPEYYAEHFAVHKRQYSMNVEAIAPMSPFSKACQSTVNNMYMTPIGFYCLSRFFESCGFSFMLILAERFQTEQVINIIKKSNLHRQGHPTLEKRHTGGSIIHNISESVRLMECSQDASGTITPHACMVRQITDGNYNCVDLKNTPLSSLAPNVGAQVVNEYKDIHSVMIGSNGGRHKLQSFNRASQIGDYFPPSSGKKLNNGLLVDGSSNDTRVVGVGRECCNESYLFLAPANIPLELFQNSINIRDPLVSAMSEFSEHVTVQDFFSPAKNGVSNPFSFFPFSVNYNIYSNIEKIANLFISPKFINKRNTCENILSHLHEKVLERRSEGLTGAKIDGSKEKLQNHEHPLAISEGYDQISRRAIALNSCSDRLHCIDVNSHEVLANRTINPKLPLVPGHYSLYSPWFERMHDVQSIPY